jgi:glycosyltransferase involved in cell wall biosynthesis
MRIQNRAFVTNIDVVEPLRILVVATKAPWPPVDGGRLVLFNTIEALASIGHRVELVAPCRDGADEVSRILGKICTTHLVPSEPRSVLGSTLVGLRRKLPVTVARHALAGVSQAVDELLAGGDIDVVHAEQLHTLPQIGAARLHGIPIVHRAHNVESLLWAYTVHHRGPATRSLTAFEARRMSAFEIRVLEETSSTVALTEVDHRALAELVPGAAIHTIAAPFVAELPTGDRSIEGEPAVTTLTSTSWAPSRDAVAHLAGEIWPVVRQRLPRAVLHVFGGGHHLDGTDGVVSHPPPKDSRTAFPRDAIVLVPERHPTGVPMKALEAWARGLPLVVDRPTAEALGAEDGAELVIADDAEGYADALARLSGDRDLRRRVVDGGRRTLAERHDPTSTTEHLVRVYRWAVESTSPHHS